MVANNVYKRRKIIKKIILSIVAILIAAMIIFPVVWILPAAFKAKKELFQIPNTIIPKKPTLNNFIKVFQIEVNGSTFIKSIFATLLVATLSTFCSLFVNMIAGYALARINFKQRKWVWIFLLFPMFIPGITIMLTSIRVVNILHMNDTIFALFVPGMANSYQMFFFRQFYLGIPRDIEEAAVIDGASRKSIFFRIFIPLSTTPMIIIGVGTFMGAWNSFIWPTLTVSENANLVQVMQIIRMLNSQYSGDYGIVIAATLMSLVVPLTIFAIFNKKIVEGIAFTGQK